MSNLHSCLRMLRVIFIVLGRSLLATALAFSMDVLILRAADRSRDYTWNNVMVGGGGWGALVFESPAAPGVVYFKDDCSSIYRLDKSATVWKKLNTWGSLPAGYTVQGASGANIACAANDPNRTYMSYDKNLFYSDNQGDSWKQGMSTDRYLKLTTDGGASFTNARGSGTIHMWGGAIYGGNAMNLCADPNVDNRFLAFSNYDFYIKTTAGKVYAILGGNSLVYGKLKPNKT